MFPISPDSTLVQVPACLDIMGGISDNAGGVCLHYPLQLVTSCRIAPRDESRISARYNGSEWVEIADATTGGATEFWARCVTRALAALQQQLGWIAPCGLSLEIESAVPRGAGLNAAISIEIAVLMALNRAFGLNLSEAQIAHFSRRPAMALALQLARENHLLQLKYQPALVEDFVALPDGLELWAVDANAGQSANADAYASALCATRMAATALSQLVPEVLRGPDGELYLANIGTDVWRALRLQIPEKLSGVEFLARYGELENIESEQIYALRGAAEHTIYEADRARRFAQLLRALNENPAARVALGRAAGELMIQSHFSYDHRCNLGSAAADLLVELARENGPKRGIYGAKICGRGGGGCVALLCDRQINADLESVVEEMGASYAQKSGNGARIYRGLA